MRAHEMTFLLQIIEDVPEVDFVVVPIGGAGLIAGVSCAIKTLKPECKVRTSITTRFGA
jgi:threonine dehydratase